jgi:hypothetical protein
MASGKFYALNAALLRAWPKMPVSWQPYGEGRPFL